MVMWIEPWQPLPSALRAMDEPNGLVAATRSLSARRLLEAYRKGLFPWYSEGQPVLWWSPHPRMVAFPADFVPRRSLRKRLRAIARAGDWRIVLDGDFRQVMEACAAPRRDGAGTWITPAVIDAYVGLHRLGHAHSFEVRDRGGVLLAGLYGVAIGRMFFGESMFTHVPDGSKCAYAAMMQTLRTLGVPMVDCQQSTGHLESLGATELSRGSFLDRVAELVRQPMPDWAGVVVRWPVDDTEGDETDAALLADRPQATDSSSSPPAAPLDDRLNHPPDNRLDDGLASGLNVSSPGSPRAPSPDASPVPPSRLPLPASVRHAAEDSRDAGSRHADPSPAPEAAGPGLPAGGLSDREP